VSVVYVDEYESSSALLQLKDPIYKVSQNNEQIRVRKAGIPPSALYLLPLAIASGALLIYWLVKKS